MSYKLKYTGEQIDNILDRAVEGGAIDDALALKAPLESPALTGTPTAPTQAEGDDSAKVATTAYADRAADAAEAAAEAAAKEYTDAATGALFITDTASGSIASFSDGSAGLPMRSVQVGIEPVQNLNGYDNPWPAGGGKNKLPFLLARVKQFNTSGTWNGDTYTLNGVTFSVVANADGAGVSITVNGVATANITFHIYDNFSLAANTYILNGTPSGMDGDKCRMYFNQGSQYADDRGSGITFTLSADTAYAYTNIYVANGYQVSNKVFQPMIRLSTEADATFAPYSNICPISGYTGAGVTRTGINLWDEETELGYYSTTDGTPKATTGSLRSKATNPIRVDENTAYYFAFPSSTQFFAYYYDKYDNYLSYVRIDTASVITTPNNCYYLRFGLTDGYGLTYTNDISINYPSSDHDYHAYLGTTYPVSWETQAGEVFGGYFVVNSDGSVDLTVTNASYAITASTTLSNFATSAEYGSRATLSPNNMELVTSETRIYVKSETAKGVSYENRVAQPDIWRVYGELSQRQIVLRAAASANIQNVDALLAPFVGTKLCYDLATPQTYHLDSIGQITSLLGQNNVWSNTGDVEVTYVADPKLYIAKMLGGGALTLGSASPLSINRPVTINEKDLEQAGEVSEAVEAADETVLPAESGETEEGAQE